MHVYIDDANAEKVTEIRPKNQKIPSCGAAIRVKPKVRLCEGIYILDSPQRKPEGLQESSRWSESAETTGKVVSHDRTPEGCQTSQ
jgi:hypothetical protein